MYIKNLVVIEGSDGSGKTTQANMLMDKLKSYNKNAARIIDFPDYESDTGKVISNMLNGDYGANPATLNPYFTSPMYSLDRYRYMKCGLNDDKFTHITIANRYTMSNLIHQGARIKDTKEFIEYWNWLYDFEFGKLNLYKPDSVIFLYVPFEVCYENVRKRAEEEGKKIDINESYEYLKLVDENINILRDISGWHFISCYDGWNGVMDSRETIHKEIFDYLCKHNNAVYNIVNYNR